MRISPGGGDVPALLVRGSGARGRGRDALPPGKADRECQATLLTDHLRSIIQARTTATTFPDGVSAVSAAVRSATGGRPERRSKITSQPVSRPSPWR